MEELRAKKVGFVKPDPVLYSDVRTVKDAKQVRTILGDRLYDDLFSDGCTSLVRHPEFKAQAGPVTFWPVLVFNTQERAIFYLYDTLEAPKDGPEPLSWRKKLPEDGSALFRKAWDVCGWK